MKSAVLNVSLDDRLSSGSIEHRFQRVMAGMRLCFRDVVGEIQSVSYDGPDGATRESCAVITVGFEASVAAFEDGVYHLAKQFNQDCIAVLHQGGEGKCIGPAADRWPFDRKFFNLPSICLLAFAA